jgi:hypothetical protein
LGFFAATEQQKAGALLMVLRLLIPQEHATIIFCSTRHHVEFVASLVRKVFIDDGLLCSLAS